MATKAIFVVIKNLAVNFVLLEQELQKFGQPNKNKLRSKTLGFCLQSFSILTPYFKNIVLLKQNKQLFFIKKYSFNSHYSALISMRGSGRHF